jgi:signal transduction histidine kinase
VDDVRSLALVQHGEGGAEIRLRPLAEVIETVLEEFEPEAVARGVALALEGAAPALEVDAARVELALMNLVGNAVKYADPAKAERWVRLRVLLSDAVDEWSVVVEDNGLGIPEPLHERVCERFFRAHPEAAEGTGLGLSIAREGLEQIGARLEFHSEAGVGSRFWIVLPGARPPAR